MKNLISTVFMALIISMSLSAQNNEGIEFKKGTWEEIKSLAKKENKNIFIDCYTTWCGPCKKLSKDIFPQQKVGEYFNANYISFKVDMEQGEGIMLKKEYNVTAFPTLLFTDSDGKLVHRVAGYMSAETLIEQAKKAPFMVAETERIINSFQNNIKDPEAVRAYLFYLIKGMDPKAEEIAEHYLSLLRKEQWVEEENLNIIKRNITNPWSPVISYLWKNQEILSEVVGEREALWIIENPYYKWANKLSTEVLYGNEFDRKAFDKLIDLMEKRNSEHKEQVIFTTDLNILCFKQDWTGYMTFLEKKYAEIGLDNLHYINDVDRYLGVLIKGCNDPAILKRAYNYYDMSVASVNGVKMYPYMKIWTQKIAILSKLDKPEELQKAKYQLSLINLLLEKERQAKASKRTIAKNG